MTCTRATQRHHPTASYCGTALTIVLRLKYRIFESGIDALHFSEELFGFTEIAPLEDKNQRHLSPGIRCR